MNPIDPQSLDTLFLKARTANGFVNKPVAPELLQRVYQLAALAPPSLNTQPTRYVFYNSQESPDSLMPAMLPGNLAKRSKGRRGGKAWVIRCRSRWTPYSSKKNKNKNNSHI